METLTRVDATEDPYLALRTTLGVGLCFALAEPLGITQPMLPIAIGMSLLSGQRGALTPRSFAGPIMLPVIAIIFSWLAAITVNEPMVFLIMNMVLAAGGIALMLFRGSRAGMMLTVFPAMMSISALYNEYALAAIRDSMVSGGLLVGIAAVITNLIFPPQTKRVHIDNPKPHVSRNPALELGIRVFVYLVTLIATYATNNISLLIAPIMMVFVCAEPDHGGRMEQVVDRGGGTIVGAVVGIVALALYNLVPQFIVLLTLLMAITFWLIDRMTTGPARPQYYQYVCSVALVVVLSSIYGTNSAMEVVVQRVTITVGIMLGGIALLSLLEAMFLGRDDSPEDLGPAPARL